MSTPAINTNVRLFDLVRYMRQELHAENLITDEEYSWLCIEADLANSPKGGSPSPRRLEDYDAIRAENAALRKTLREVFDFTMPHPNDGRASEFCEHLPKYVKLYAEVEKILEVKP